MHDFTLASYEDFLRRAQLHDIEILRVKDHSRVRKGQASIILRHDIDFSLDAALKMAESEAALGVVSTYFVLLRSPFYNALSPRGTEIIRRISSLGHEIGLHWDGSLLSSETTRAHDTLKSEAQILGSLAGQTVVSAAQHVPRLGYLDVSDLFENDTYSESFQKSYAYVSDSSMRWRTRNLNDVLSEKAHFHLLIHPIWWATAGDDYRGKIATLCETQAHDLRREYDAFLAIIDDGLVRRTEIDRSFEKRNQ